MANVASITTTHGIRARLDAFWAALAHGMNTYMESRSRADRIQALNAKSDAELAKMGISRAEIPAYVFRDVFYI